MLITIKSCECMSSNKRRVLYTHLIQKFITRWVRWCKMVISVRKLQYLWGPNNVSLTLFKGGIVTPTATLISKDKIFEIHIKISTIPSVLIEIGTIPSLLIQISKIRIEIRVCTSAMMLFKMCKICTI